MCPHCRKTLHARDLIPVLSFLMTKGKCRFCKKKISLHYLLLEVTTGILFILVYRTFPFMLATESWSIISIDGSLLLSCISQWITSVFLVGIFFYDLQYMEIPDAFLFPLIVITLLSSLLGGKSIMDLAIALGIAVIFFGGQHFISGGKWLGEGDVYLAVSMAFLFGWKLFLVAIIVTYLIGSFLGISLILFKKLKKNTKIPFGPFMVLGTLTTFYLGEEILQWYLTLLSL